MANNNILWCAVFDAALYASQTGRVRPVHTVAQAGLISACQAFATEVDAQIAIDTTITTGGGGAVLAITGGSNAQIGPELAKRDLLFAIVSGVLAGRVLTDATAADYATLATQIAALYSAGVTAQAAFVP